MKLNGWQRIGIIASVIWVPVAGLYTLNWLSDKDIKAAGFLYDQCASIRDEANHTHRVECEKQSERAPEIDMTTVFNQCMVPYEQEFEQMDAKCTKESEDYAIQTLPGERLGATIAAFVPVPFAWGAVYLVLFLIRWVRKGWDGSLN